MHDGFSELPGFTAIKQNGLYIGIEDPAFGDVIDTILHPRKPEFSYMLLVIRTWKLFDC